jgi:hypothetical protein
LLSFDEYLLGLEKKFVCSLREGIALTGEGTTVADHAEVEGMLILETINPSDMTEEDLVELGAALAKGTELSIAIGYEDQHGAGVTWHEVIQVWLPSAEFFKEQAWLFLSGVIFENLRRRFRRPGNERRPKSLVVRDLETGEVLREYVIEEEDAVPKVVEPDQSPRHRPRLRRKLNDS